MKLFEKKKTEVTEEEATRKLDVMIEPDEETEEATKGIERIEEVNTEPAYSYQEEEDEDEYEDDDDEYEYVTPNYFAYGFMISLLSIIIGAAVVFLLVNGPMQQEIRNSYLAQGYVKTTGSNATASEIEAGKTAYVNGKLVTGTFVEIDTSYATATEADILSGYTAYVNGAKVIGKIPTFTPGSYTPGTKDIVIPKGYYIDGKITIQGSPNLLPENIKEGVEIFGVKGTYKYTGN